MWYQMGRRGLRCWAHLVKRVIAHTGNTFIVREKPKSKKSRRAIPLDHELAEELLSLRKSLTDILDHMSDLERHEAIKDMYVFGNPTPRKGESEYMNPRVLYKAWRRLVDKLDLQTANGMSPKFHDLRHTFATIWANSENNDIGTLTKVLGHSDESVTRKYYINIEEETLRRGVNGVSSAIRSRGAQADVIEFEKTERRIGKRRNGSQASSRLHQATLALQRRPSRMVMLTQTLNEETSKG